MVTVMGRNAADASDMIIPCVPKILLSTDKNSKALQGRNQTARDVVPRDIARLTKALTGRDPVNRFRNQFLDRALSGLLGLYVASALGFAQR